MTKLKDVHLHNGITLGLEPPFRHVNTMIAKSFEMVGKANHSHPFYHLNYITEGKLTVTFKGVEHPISAGQAFILPPNIPHTIYTESGYAQIGTDLDVVPDKKGLLNLIKAIAENEFCITGRLNIGITFDEVDRLVLNPTELNILQIQNLAESILLKTVASLTSNGPSAFAEKFEQALLKCGNDITLTQLCKHTGYSKVHIERLANAEFGCGAIEYLNRLKINRISSLIINTDLSLNEIAEAEGFFDASHLTVFFKKRMGMTPGQYRKGYTK